LNISGVEIGKTENDKFGDYSTNAALKLAKKEGRNPLELAKELVEKINQDKAGREIFARVEAVKPGFINFFLSPDYLQRQVAEILKLGDDYGQSNLGQKQKIQVEFISANPTGPLTVGNSRGGVIGDVLAQVFEISGWRVTREYYFNDAGGQIDVLGHSVLKDDLAEYKGEYIDKLHAELESGDYKEIGKKAAQILIEQIKETTRKMGIEYDVWFAEGRDLREKNKIEEIVGWLKEKSLAYEKEGALWFKSTLFGDDKDRVLIRSNGEPTYFAIDCAYHKNKFVERAFDKVIDIWGADHHGDVPRVKGFVKALGFEKNFEILLHQFVRVLKDGKEVRMSKRAGNYVAVEDLLDEVGKDVYRFFMLQYSPNTHMDFNLDLAKEQSQKNPVYYVQYAHARICAILRKSAQSQISDLKSQINFKKQISNFKLELLKEPAEMDLIKQLIRLPEIVEDAAKDYQVQRLPQFALELVRNFHKFYEQCRVISDDQSLTQARLALIEAARIALKNTLDLMGISAPEKM